MLTELIEKLKTNQISLRSFISTIKNDKILLNEVENLTSFLDIYNVSINERLYYIVNDIHSVVKCKYCDNKATFSGRIKDGYKETCSNKECISKMFSNLKQGSTKISENRNKEFLEIQSSIIEVNDKVILDVIKYDNQIELIDNPIILSYLDRRYKDSYSRIETFQRIQQNIEEKPKCPTCGKPVVWVGRKNKLFTKYCCDACSNSNEDVILKKKQTQLKNWGSLNCYDSSAYKEKMLNTYGVEYQWQRKDLKEKRRNTILNRYGTTSLFHVDEIKQKIIDTNRKKYGVDSIFQLQSVRQKAMEKIIENGKSGTSNEEENIYNWLIELGFNVERHKYSNSFPFNVDFYLKDYDLYLEYQGSQFHNGRAYLGTKEDLDEIKKLEIKNEDRIKISGDEKSQYKSIINTWVIYDVKKREYARDHKINYLELFNCKSKNELLYQLNMYMIFTNNIVFNISDKTLQDEFNRYKRLHINEFSKCSKKYSNFIVKHFQSNNFYKHEIELYKDPVIRRKIIQNRIKYLNKTENELTINDIISGFKISGTYYGYSHFNPEWTNYFITKYDIKSVYDPCGGWGHHILGMINCNKILYNDLDNETYSNVLKLKEYFNLNNLYCTNNNALEMNPENVDAFFMCPPYYNLEIYNNVKAFENIDEYKKFLNNIFDIWNKNNAKLFGLVIREDYYELLDEKYKNLIIEKEELYQSKSHLIKNKKYKEILYIFQK